MHKFSAKVDFIEEETRRELGFTLFIVVMFFCLIPLSCAWRCLARCGNLIRYLLRLMYEQRKTLGANPGFFSCVTQVYQRGLSFGSIAVKAEIEFFCFFH